MSTPTLTRGRPAESLDTAARGAPVRRGGTPALCALFAGVAVLVVASLLVGGYDIDPREMADDPEQMRMFLVSRVPRTLALVLAATVMSVCGVIMQMITQNRFVEPTTAGTADWAGLGILLTLVLWPGAPVLARMALASAAAFIGTLVFLAILRRIAVRNSVVVPLAGIMLGAVVGAISTFLAGQFSLLQSMSAWRSGGFSSIVEGFYEPLWAVLVVTALAWIAADRFTVAGLGEDTATSLGVNYHAVVLLGTCLVALATGITSVVVGFVPFLGLVVPNLVSMVLGDDLRRNLPWVALTGTALLLVCDLVGRVVVAPMEIPASVILGVVGAVFFVVLVVRSRRDVG
ncbi:ABC transporter permease [Mobilicoccus pelagius]|uniref:Putative ABC transporter permease protein n=1 Tax=Mobilicoccus pelagius NBRC 104925 TaxID=1089455 RepID=H5UUL6_9MICO|nr:iron chelate uptake ABC transporter family permease subunit [Mobilicoccus pelagius]GAB49424.1 putative ABC transporter permease protein [Mobilicoccus pelagius NBRC 104925]